MSLEKQSKKINKKEIESSKNIDSNSGKAAKGAFREFVDKHFNWRKSAIITGAAAISLSSMGQSNTEKKADEIFMNGENKKTEWFVKLPKGDDRCIYFNSQREMDEFLEISKLIKNSKETNFGNGDLVSIYKNRVAERQEKSNFKERNVFNDQKIAEQAVLEINGWLKHSYFPGQVGNKSPFWEKTGSIVINNMDDYKKHVEENLLPQGFKGELIPDIKYFGFKLEKNEFITTLKYNTIVNADVAGGRGYVPLLEGTRVVFERMVLQDGDVCNRLKYILDCKNAIYGDFLYLKNGQKLYIKHDFKNNKISYSKEKDGEYIEYEVEK